MSLRLDTCDDPGVDVAIPSKGRMEKKNFIYAKCGPPTNFSSSFLSTMSRNNPLVCSSCNATFDDKVELAMHSISHNQFRLQSSSSSTATSGCWSIQGTYAPSSPSPLSTQVQVPKAAPPLPHGVNQDRMNQDGTNQDGTNQDGFEKRKERARE
jgi:hypothetical protein